MTDVSYDNLSKLGSICGVSLRTAAKRAGISARSVEKWANGRHPRPDNFGRVWNAVIEESSECGRLTAFVKTRLKNELGITL